MTDWRAIAYRIVRPLLFAFDPERIHRLTIAGLRLAGAHATSRALLRLAGGVPPDADAGVQLMGLTFRNRVGIGAGFISFVVLRTIQGRWREPHVLLWAIAVLFAAYFALHPIKQALGVA